MKDATELVKKCGWHIKTFVMPCLVANQITAI